MSYALALASHTYAICPEENSGGCRSKVNEQIGGTGLNRAAA